MNNTNTVVITGNLARDPEIRYTTSGVPVAQFTVACNQSWEAKDGTKKESTDFVPCEAWEGWAEKLSGYTKGQPVYVTGRVITQSWEGKDGKKQYKTLVRCSSVTTMASKRKAETPRPAARPEHPLSKDSDNSDDVPF